MKTFELTQEQINQLAEKKHAKELLKEFLPEAFENKLEVGKWYRLRNKNNKTLFVPNKETCDYDMGYGFTYQGIYKECGFNLIGSYPNNFELATEEEVSEALINEFKKRLGKHKKVKTLKDKWEEPIIIEVNFEEFRYYHKENELWTSCKKTGIGYKVFDNGKWAEIIEEPKETEPTEEEIKRVLNYLLKNGEKLHNEI